jgi:hypothetical protein
VYACLLIVCYLFLPVIESNDTECTEEGEVYEYQEEEDQGLANQGKPSILDTYLILTYLACLLKVYQNACFISLVENGSLVQHLNAIFPGSAGQWGPMTGLGPGSCRLEVGPGSFWSIGPCLWHQPGPMPPSPPRGTWRSAEHWSRFMPRTRIKYPPLAINKPSPLPPNFAGLCVRCGC